MSQFSSLGGINAVSAWISARKLASFLDFVLTLPRFRVRIKDRVS